MAAGPAAAPDFDVPAVRYVPHDVRRHSPLCGRDRQRVGGRRSGGEETDDADIVQFLKKKVRNPEGMPTFKLLEGQALDR